MDNKTSQHNDRSRVPASATSGRGHAVQGASDTGPDKPAETEPKPDETVKLEESTLKVDEAPKVEEPKIDEVPKVEEPMAEVAVAEKPAESPAVEKQPSGFIPNLDEVLATSKSRTSGGTRIRANVGYTLVASGVTKLIGGNIPDQQKVILGIMNRALTVDKPIISEPELHKLILAAHERGALKTKQDPWHIFRYYRTGLKTAGVLREVPVQVSEEDLKKIQAAIAEGKEKPKAA
jgi:hypothetical protein